MKDGPEVIERGLTQQQHYVSVASSVYIVNAVAQIMALERLSKSAFSHHILCMDRQAHSILQSLARDNVEAVFVDDFEDAALLKCRQERTLTEYCWTVKPPFLLHLLRSHPDWEALTFLDADIFPFADLTPLWEQLTGADVVLYPHNFIPELDFLNTNSGRYNAGMISFRNTPNGQAVLSWWIERCLEWCFLINEPDRLGDQKYLLSFSKHFSGIADSLHLGIDVGPWGIGQYRPFEKDGQVWLSPNVQLLLFHFHQYDYRNGDYVAASEMYPIDKEALRLIYDRYTAAYAEALAIVRKDFPAFSKEC